MNKYSSLIKMNILQINKKNADFGAVPDIEN